jgi:hypothetical protein
MDGITNTLKNVAMTASVPLPPAEHIEWAKQRAFEYVEAGQLVLAVASLISDLGKHPAIDVAVVARLGEELLVAATRGDAVAVGSLIDAVNWRT